MNPHMTIDGRNLTTASGEFRIEMYDADGTRTITTVKCNRDTRMGEPHRSLYGTSWLKCGPETAISVPGADTRGPAAALVLDPPPCRTPEPAR